jgi:hypothetical protein
MEDYPFASYYATEETVTRIGLGSNVDNKNRSVWYYSKNPRRETEMMFYNDEGVAEYRTFTLPIDHDLGIDAIPQLIEEGLYRDKWMPIGSVMWTKQIGKRHKKDFEELCALIRDRTHYLSSPASLSRAEIPIHKDAFQRDIGQALETITDDDVAYQYVRNQLLLENISAETNNSLVYYPLSILIRLVKGNKFSIIGGNRFEYKTLICLHNYKDLKYVEKGIMLNKELIIERSNVSQWLDIAYELSRTRFEVNDGRHVTLMEEGAYNINRLKKASYSDIVYILSRNVYKGSISPTVLLDLTETGYEYRGLYVYALQGKRDIKYPIWYFSKKIIGVSFPPKIKSLFRNNAAIPFPTKDAQWDYSDRSLGTAGLLPYVVPSGSLSYYGAMMTTEVELKEELDIMRESPGNLFIPILLPSKIDMKSTASYVNNEEPSVHYIYSDYLSYTTITVYKGGFGKADITHKIGNWYLSRKGSNWYLHSEKEKIVKGTVWKKLASLQTHPKALIDIKRSVDIQSRLSYSSLVRYWSQLRYSDIKTHNERAWSGDTYQIVSQNITSSTVATRNSFGVMSYYSLPVQTYDASPESLYPLPIVQEGIKKLVMAKNGQLMSFSTDSSPVVNVRVVDGEISIYDPLDKMNKAVNVADGTYKARLDSNLEWTIEGLSSELIPMEERDLLDYYMSHLYLVTEEDLRIPPKVDTIHLYGSVGVSGVLSAVTIHDDAIVASNNMRDITEIIGRSDDPRRVTVGDIPEWNKTILDDTIIHTEAVLFRENEYISIRGTTSQLFKLPHDWNISRINAKTLVVEYLATENVKSSFYSMGDEINIEISSNFGDLILYTAFPDDEQLYSQLSELNTEFIDELLSESSVKLVSRGAIRESELKNALMRALFG